MATTSGLATPARAQVNQLPAELEEVGIDEKAGAVAPRDLRFTDQDGRSILLGDYFDGQRRWCWCWPITSARCCAAWC